MISKRLSNLSSNERVFHEEKTIYETALKNSGHPYELKYSQPVENKRKRSRQPIYYNPPFSLNVKTNVGAAFLKLVDKHFPKGSKLGKYLNRTKLKVSYCTMINMKKHISRHNAKILRNPTEEKNSTSCNCRVKPNCPLNGNCLEKDVVYQADVDPKIGNQIKTYYGLTEQTFKDRWYNHQHSLRHLNTTHKTALSSGGT